MATENNPKSKPKKLAKLGSKSKPSAIPNVVEMVPDWLRMLLGKYGEAEGRLVGLQEPPPEFPEDVASATAPTFEQPEAGELSALLEQMAEDGGPAMAGERSATSVEWGDFPEEPALPPIAGLGAAAALSQADQDEIPDWLNDLDTPGAQPPADDVPDWLKEAAPITIQDQADAPISDLDVPDWLNDAASLPVPDQPDTLIGDQEDVPDWIDETVPSSAIVDAEDDIAVPDWLSEPAEDEISAEIPPSPAAIDTTDDEFDIPDWLASMAPPVAGAAGAAAAVSALQKDEEEPGTTGDITDWDVPDWINAEEPIEFQAEPPAFTDAFAADLATDTDIPDWLAATDEVDTSTAPQPEDDWMAGLRAQVDTGEQPPTDQIVVPEATFETDIEDIELPDWLTATDDTTLETDSSTAVSDLPDWLSAEPEVNEVPVITPDSADSPSIDMPTAVEAPYENEIPDWLDNKAEEVEVLDRLAQLPDTDEDDDSGINVGLLGGAAVAAGLAAGAVAISASDKAEEDEDIPDWLTDLPAAETGPVEAVAAEDEGTPDWLAELPAETEDEDIPDWLAELPAGDESEEDDSGINVGLLGGAAAAAGLAAGAAAISASDEAEEDEDLPDWLTDLPATETGPVEVVAAEDEGTPDWLAELPAETEEDEETPDWLAELPAETEEDEDLPDWLTDLPAAETGPVEVVAAEDEGTPDWLAELPAETEDKDTPDWLAELPAVDESEEDDSGINVGLLGAAAAGLAAGAAAISASGEAEEDEDLPDWLTDLPAAETGPVEVVAAEDEGTPDWLAELPADTEDEDTPDWLAELPAETEDDDSGINVGLLGGAAVAAGLAAGAAAISASDEDEDLPNWLAELPTAETSSVEVIAEEDEGTPDWLAELPIEAEDEGTPDWLAELPVEAEDDDSGINVGLLGGAAAAAGLAASAAAISASDEAEEDEDLPDWLAELPTAETSSVETIAEEDEGTPDWLAELPAVDESEEDDSGINVGLLGGAAAAAGLAASAAAISASDEAEEDEDLPDWLAELPTAETSSVETIAEEDEGTPDWLAELPVETEDEGTPDWLAELPVDGEDDSTEATNEDAPDWLAGLQQSIAASAVADEDDEEIPDWLSELPTTATGETSTIEASATDQDNDDFLSFDENELEVPDWLEESSLDDLETPEWLKDNTEEQPPPDSETGAGGDWMSGLRQSAATDPDWLDSDDDSDLPDWPEEGDASSKKSEGGPSPDALSVEASDTAGGSPEPPTPILNETDEPQTDDDAGFVAAAALGATAAGAAGAAVTTATTAASSAATGKMAGWLDAMQADDTTRTTRVQSEATGIFTGISTLLPSEKVTIPTAVPAQDADSLAAAAQQFHVIATTPPQPATLPKAIGQQEKIAAGFVRSALYLLLLVLVTLPLLPPLQKVIDPETGLRAPWTEPSQEFSDVLDSQRRQLISQQLGIVDLQQPDTVALVSFDYTTATQGEMQPLVDAVLGRLKGQGMRIIGVSLEPEGAPIAQQTFEKLADDREENYGDSLVNLGYLPGQAAAVRRLATGQQSLATLPDYETGLTFTAASSQQWQDVTDLRQVDMVVTFADNPVTARWWVEQLQIAAPADSGERYILAAVSAVAEPFLTPFRDNEQLDGLIAGIGGAAAIEAGRRNFGPARQMIDSMSLAHLAVVILIAVGTIVGWMPSDDSHGAEASGGGTTSGLPNQGQGINV